MIIALLCLLSSKSVFALYGQVEILNASSSGKTIIINVGLDQKINNEDFGILLEKSSSPSKNDELIKNTVLKPVAKIRAVKIFQNTSVWVVFETFASNKVRKNSKLLIVSQEELLRGRSKLKIKKSKLIGTDNYKEELKETLLEEGQFLAKRVDRYKTVDDIHDKDIKSNDDINLIDLEKWEDLTGTGKKSPISIYKSSYAKSFADRKRLDTFEKMSYAMLKKYNHPNYSRDTHYKEQKRVEGINDLQENRSGGSVYSNYKENLVNKQAKEEKFYQDTLSKGETWSDDYSDEELSELLHNVSIIYERERRDDILAFKYNYQLYFTFGFNLLDNQILSDAENGQDKKYELEFSIESYALKKFEDLNRFSFEFSLRRSEDGVNIGGSNALMIDYSGAAQMNWYPFHAPNTIHKNILYVGSLFRFGVASLLDQPSGDVASYQVFSLPGLKFGIKYNFPSSLGLRVSASYENVQLDRIEKSNNASILPDRQSLLEGKLAVGLTKLF